MTKREELNNQIINKKESIKIIKAEILDLYKESLMLTDDVQQFTEKMETVTKRVNKKKIKEERLVGRINWIDNFKDGDTGETFPVERSQIVRINGEWIKFE